MKTRLLPIASFLAFALVSSCGEREDASTTEDSAPPPEMERVVTVLQSDG